MKKLYLIVVMSALLLLPAFNANAYDRGDKLLWACTDKIEKYQKPEELIPIALEKAKCFGYISGVLDGAQMVFGLHPESKFFCPPKDGMSIEQQVRIVMKYLTDNPEVLHESARSSIIVAYQNAFPCR